MTDVNAGGQTGMEDPPKQLNPFLKVTATLLQGKDSVDADPSILRMRLLFQASQGGNIQSIRGAI